MKNIMAGDEEEGEEVMPNRDSKEKRPEEQGYATGCNMSAEDTHQHLSVTVAASGVRNPIVPQPLHQISQGMIFLL